VAKQELEQQRLDKVNKFIRHIGDRWRRFFRYKERHALMELDDRGRVWFVDDYHGERNYTHRNARWRGFSHGGTLKSLVNVFRYHIKKGYQLHHLYFDPGRFRGLGTPPWGYPDGELVLLKHAGLTLGIVAPALEEGAS